MMVIGVGIAWPQPQLKLQISISRRRLSQFRCALSKQGDRFLGSLLVASPNSDDLHRLLRKFVASSSKSVALATLCHLHSPTTAAAHPRLSSFALPLYLAITEARWFDWNAKLGADMVALLHKQKRSDEAGTLIAETLCKLSHRKRETCGFYCHLIEAQSKHKSSEGVLESCAQLQQLLLSCSHYLKRCGYKSMIEAMSGVGLPFEAEELMKEMRGLGLKPSTFEFRCLVYGYGKTGMFRDMKRILAQMEGEGFPHDIVTSNMVLSSLGAHQELLEMASWLQKMKDSGVAVSTRTYNSVLNHCPKLNMLLDNTKDLPLSLEELAANLSRDERSLVIQLVASSPPVMKEEVLDLHGAHLGTAYLVMLRWFDELRSKCESGNGELPLEIRVVCGVGKHSAVRGKSPVKDLVKKMIVQMKCPLRNDRENIGCFVAKGKVVKDWILYKS